MYQTRSEDTGMNEFSTLALALDAAKANVTIWKISFFSSVNERIRLVRGTDGKFYLSQLMDEVMDEMGEWITILPKD